MEKVPTKRSRDEIQTNLKLTTSQPSPAERLQMYREFKAAPSLQNSAPRPLNGSSGSNHTKEASALKGRAPGTLNHHGCEDSALQLLLS